MSQSQLTSCKHEEKEKGKRQVGCAVPIVAFLLNPRLFPHNILSRFYLNETTKTAMMLHTPSPPPDRATQRRSIDSLSFNAQTFVNVTKAVRMRKRKREMKFLAGIEIMYVRFSQRNFMLQYSDYIIIILLYVQQAHCRLQYLHFSFCVVPAAVSFMQAFPITFEFILMGLVFCWELCTSPISYLSLAAHTYFLLSLQPHSSIRFNNKIILWVQALHMHYRIIACEIVVRNIL